jgi:hypothetical protein
MVHALFNHDVPSTDTLGELLGTISRAGLVVCSNVEVKRHSNIFEGNSLYVFGPTFEILFHGHELGHLTLDGYLRHVEVLVDREGREVCSWDWAREHHAEGRRIALAGQLLVSRVPASAVHVGLFPVEQRLVLIIKKHRRVITDCRANLACSDEVSTLNLLVEVSRVFGKAIERLERTARVANVLDLRAASLSQDKVDESWKIFRTHIGPGVIVEVFVVPRK